MPLISHFAPPSEQTNNSGRKPDRSRPACGVGWRRRHDFVAPLLYPWRESLGYDRVARLILLVVELCNCPVVCISHTLLFPTIFSNDSLVRRRIFLPGISGVIFKKPVQMGSRFGPDLVQIWSRFGPDFAVHTVWTNFGNHPMSL